MTLARRCFRLVRAGFVAGARGRRRRSARRSLPPLPRSAGASARLLDAPARAAGAPRRAAVAALDRLGPSYVKLGQFLATRPDIVGATSRRPRACCRTRWRPSRRRRRSRPIEGSLGRPVERPLRAASSTPVAAASIAQVHQAEVAPMATARRRSRSRCCGPACASASSATSRAIFLAARLLERYRPAIAPAAAGRGGRDARPTVAIEMDLRLEAAALSEMAENTARRSRLPRAAGRLGAAPARDVLTHRVDRRHQDVRRRRRSAPPATTCRRSPHLIQSFLRHALRDGFFHADMHPGNLFVDADGDIVAVDFGIMGRLGSKERRFLAEILYGFITRDYRRVAEVHFEAGYVPGASHPSRISPRRIRAIGEPIHGQPADDISMAGC